MYECLTSLCMNSYCSCLNFCATVTFRSCLQPVIYTIMYLTHACNYLLPLLQYVHTYSEDWYGLLYSQTSNSKKANLVLCVFYPNSDIPWLGPFLYLGPKPSTITDPRMAHLQPDKPSFPVTPSHLPSFHSPSNLLWAKETLLQVT